MPNAHLVLHYPRQRVHTYNVGGQQKLVSVDDPETGKSHPAIMEMFADQTENEFKIRLKDKMFEMIENMALDYPGLQYLDGEVYFQDVYGYQDEEETRYIKRMNLVANHEITDAETEALGLLVEEIKKAGYKVEEFIETEATEAKSELVLESRSEQKPKQLMGGVH